MGYYAIIDHADTVELYDLRFGSASIFTNGMVKKPIFGYGMVVDNQIVNKTIALPPTKAWKHVNFGMYLHNVFNE